MYKIKTKDGRDVVEEQSGDIIQAQNKKLSKLISQIKEQKILFPELSVLSDILIDRIESKPAGIQHGEVGYIKFTFFIDENTFWIIKKVKDHTSKKFYSNLDIKSCLENYRVINLLFGEEL